MSIDKLINKPFLAVAEAKKEDFTKGWAQCLAEMIACQKINADESVVIYGIVPTGLVWEFGKLEQDTFTKHIFSYSIRDPNQIFGILDFIFAECEKRDNLGIDQDLRTSIVVARLSRFIGDLSGVGNGVLRR